MTSKTTFYAKYCDFEFEKTNIDSLPSGLCSEYSTFSVLNFIK